MQRRHVLRRILEAQFQYSASEVWDKNQKFALFATRQGREQRCAEDQPNQASKSSTVKAPACRPTSESKVSPTAATYRKAGPLYTVLTRKRRPATVRPSFASTWCRQQARRAIRQGTRPEVRVTCTDGCHYGDATLAMPKNCASCLKIGITRLCRTVDDRSPDICNSAIHRRLRQIRQSAQFGQFNFNYGMVNGSETNAIRKSATQHYASACGA